MVWLESAGAYLAAVKAAYQRHEFAPESYLVPLSCLAATLWARDGKLRVLDFGGGIGVNFYYVAAALPEDAGFQYDIVDSGANCAAGRQQYIDEKRCKFVESIPSAHYDLILASSAMQYVKDWREALSKLARCQPQYVCLTRLPLTSGPTFVARQQIHITSGPHTGANAGTAAHWFFNAGELCSSLKAVGFQLIYRQFIADLGPHLQLAERLAHDCTLGCLVFQRDQHA